MTKRDEARCRLRNLFAAVAPSDVRWPDWAVEIGECVDILIDAAKEELANSILSNSEQGDALGGTEE